MTRDFAMWPIRIKKARTAKSGRYRACQATTDSDMTQVLALGRHRGEDCRTSALAADSLAVKRVGDAKP
jgi:hypothetical protein